MAKREYLIGLGAFVALLCLMVVLYSASKQGGGPPIPVAPSGTYTQHGSQPYGTLPIQVMDPSFLPKGTGALWVTFANSSVYSQGGGWISAGGYGPINLDAGANQSVTVSDVSVPYNSIITAARLGIRSASIVINGTSYNVTVPGRTMSANLSGARFQGGNALLVSLSPFVLASAGSSNSVELGYSARGYIVNSSVSYVGQPNRVALSSAQSVTPYANISIEGATVETSGDTTMVKVTVVNHSNRGASIDRVVVLGTESFGYNTSAIAELGSRYADEIIQRYSSASNSPSISGSSGLIGELFNGSASSVSAGINPAIYSKALGLGSNLSSIIYANISALAQLAGPLPKSLISGSVVNLTALKSAVYQNMYDGLFNATVSDSNFQSRVGSIGFRASQNGTLMQSSGSGDGGYYLQPNSSVTLSYIGQMHLDNTTSIGFVMGDSYQVLVTGNNGVVASYPVNSIG